MSGFWVSFSLHQPSAQPKLLHTANRRRRIQPGWRQDSSVTRIKVHTVALWHPQPYESEDGKTLRLQQMLNSEVSRLGGWSSQPPINLGNQPGFLSAFSSLSVLISMLTTYVITTHLIICCSKPWVCSQRRQIPIIQVCPRMKKMASAC